MAITVDICAVKTICPHAMTYLWANMNVISNRTVRYWIYLLLASRYEEKTVANFKYIFLRQISLQPRPHSLHFTNLRTRYKHNRDISWYGPAIITHLLIWCTKLEYIGFIIFEQILERLISVRATGRSLFGCNWISWINFCLVSSSSALLIL